MINVRLIKWMVCNYPEGTPPLRLAEALPRGDSSTLYWKLSFRKHQSNARPRGRPPKGNHSATWRLGRGKDYVSIVSGAFFWIASPWIPLATESNRLSLCSRLTCGSANDAGTRGVQVLPELRDLDQPFIFDISLWNRPYRFEFYDTASPTSYTVIRPSVLVLCYSIPHRSSLKSVHTRWKYEVETHFNYDEQLPVILLGLKRDLRREGDPEMVIPQEGLRIAQEMRCDRYAECSAVTAELCREVFEDLAKTAAMTTTAKGGKSEPASCVVL